MKQNSKKERKKPKHIRDAQKSHEANIYNEGFKHGYRMGLEKGKSMKE